MSFHGELLRRGFWLYVWDIRTGDERHLYVGGTGDGTFGDTSSPLQRVAQHLDFRESAKANSLAKQLKTVAIEPSLCSFELTALGPLFPERSEEDKAFHDRVAALEAMLARHLRERGYSVIGAHSSRRAPDPEIWAQVCEIIGKKFVDRGVSFNQDTEQIVDSFGRSLLSKRKSDKNRE